MAAMAAGGTVPADVEVVVEVVEVEPDVVVQTRVPAAAAATSLVRVFDP
jgi:hypothetical protein